MNTELPTFGTNPENKSSFSGSFLLPIILLVVLIGGAAAWFYFKPLEQSLNTSSPISTDSNSRTDSVIIGVKSAPLGFYGQEKVQYESPTFNFNSNIFEGLTTFTKDLKFASRQLVESWDNPSDTVWRLRLRKGIKFHNGADFSAEDAKFSIDFGKKYVVQDDLAQVKEVRIVDPFTIEVETQGPAPLLLNNLINVFVVNKKYAEANGGIKSKVDPESQEVSYFIDFPNPVGTGPYTYVSQSDNEYKITANENYYLGPPKIKNVSYRVVEDDNERAEAILSGKVDLIEDVPSARRADLVGSKDLEVKGVPSLRVIYLGMDTSSAKTKYSTSPTNPFKKLAVRQAIYKAIDETEIISQVMGGHAYDATQPATSVNFGFNPNLKRPAYNIAEAKELLSSAGYPNGFDIVLDVPNNRYQNDAAIGQRVVEQLAKVGIKATLNAQPKEDFFPKILDNKDTSFYLLGWSQENGDAGGAYGTLIHTTDEDAGYGSFNIGGYSNKSVDKLIESSDNTVDSVGRLKILQDLASTTMADVPIIPLHQQEDSFAISKRFNWTPRRDNGIRAFEITLK